MRARRRNERVVVDAETFLRPNFQAFLFVITPLPDDKKKISSPAPRSNCYRTNRPWLPYRPSAGLLLTLRARHTGWEGNCAPPCSTAPRMRTHMHGFSARLPADAEFHAHGARTFQYAVPGAAYCEFHSIRRHGTASAVRTRDPEREHARTHRPRAALSSFMRVSLPTRSPGSGWLPGSHRGRRRPNRLPLHALRFPPTQVFPAV